MHTLLLTAIEILHLGPGIAFAVVAFGCGDIEPALGQACKIGDFKLFAVATLLGWTILSSLALTMHLWSRMKKRDVRK